MLSRSDDRQAFLRRLNDTIRPLADPARILAETCRLIGRHLRVNRVIYGEVEGDDCTVVNDYVDGLPSQSGRFRWTELAGSRTEEILKGGTLFVNDTLTERIRQPSARRCRRRASAPTSVHSSSRTAGSSGRSGFTAASRACGRRTRSRWCRTSPIGSGRRSSIARLKPNLRANEERLQFLLLLNDALRPLSDPGDVQETAARLLGQHLGTTRVGYAELDGSAYVIRRE